MVMNLEVELREKIPSCMSRDSRRQFRPLVKLEGGGERETETESTSEYVHEIITKSNSVSCVYLQASLKVMSQHIEIHLVKMVH